MKMYLSLFSNLKYILLVILFVCIVTLFSGCNFISNDESVQYLNNFERADNYIVTDGYDHFCTNAGCVDLSSETGLDVYNILYADENNLFFSVMNKNFNGYNIYRCSYNFNDVVKVYEVEQDFYTYKMLSDNLFFYNTGDMCYLYNIVEDSTQVVSADYAELYIQERSSYIYSTNKNFIFADVLSFSITRKSDGATREIQADDMLNLEPAKYIDENYDSSIAMNDIYFVGDKIYVIGFAAGCAVIFTYDFDYGALEYYSWVNTKEMSSEPRSFFFF